MAPSDENKNKIALFLVKHWIKTSKMAIGDLRNYLTAVVKGTDIDVEELIEFLFPIYLEAMKEGLAPKLPKTKTVAGFVIPKRGAEEGK
jgi:hypothetical protein